MLAENAVNTALLGLCLLPIGLVIMALSLSRGDKTVTIKPQNPLTGVRAEVQQELDQKSRDTLYWQQEYQRSKNNGK